MNTTTQRPTPETDQAWAKWPYAGPGVHANFARKLERERDEARDWQNVKVSKAGETHTLGTLIQLLEHERDEKEKQLEAMREAIKDAHYALTYVYNHGAGSCAFPFRTEDDLCSENRFHHVKDALDALKPFLEFPNI